MYSEGHSGCQSREILLLHLQKLSKHEVYLEEVSFPSHFLLYFFCNLNTFSWL